ncbi:methionine gamma-lyase [Candidatus Kapaibacterium sp.]
MKISNAKVDTLCVHSGTKESKEGAVVTPIFQTSTFKFQSAEHGARLFKGEEDGYIYTRMRNPTVEAMEDAVAILEGGAKAIGCASGMAAVHLILAASVKAGEHVICSESVYGPTVTILKDLFTTFNVEVSFVDTSKIENVESAFRTNTKLVHIETPGNPTLVMSDIAMISEIAHKRGAKVSVDNTFMSPIMQRPFDHGADYIMHSMTKYLNGHADVVAGIVVIKDITEYPKFRKVSNLVGGVIDPFNSFLVHRGIKTLALRVRKQAENAFEVAKYLANHPKVEWVMYPGLESHPQYSMGLKQMTGHGSMISVELKGGYEAGKKLMDNIELFVLAVSLGGVESLIQHPASMTHASMGKEAREQAKITDGLVRIAVGIEDVDDLIAALDRGLQLV